MADEFQNRTDIDRLYDLIYDRESDSLKLTTKTEFNQLLEKFGFNQPNKDKFNHAIVTRETEDYWILNNAKYDYATSQFKKVDMETPSQAIQITPSAIHIYTNPKSTDVEFDTNTYDYSEYLTNQVLGARRISDNTFVEFGISSGWTIVEEETVHITDSIEDGNMDAVTSNAVYDGLQTKLNVSDAFSGDYNDLTNKPTDSGWITATIDDTYFWDDDNNPVRYRKIGNTVSVEGSELLLHTALPNFQAKIFQLPSGYRPSRQTYFICEFMTSTSYGLWCCQIDTDGWIYVKYVIVDGAIVTGISGGAFRFNVSFVI